MRDRFAFCNAGLALAALFSLGIATTSFSQGSKAQLSSAQRQAISERHKKIAEMHTKMASCIVSDKSPAACRQEMVDSCSTNFGGTCPMMGRENMGPGGHGKGMMNGTCMDWMISPESEATAPAATQPKK